MTAPRRAPGRLRPRTRLPAPTPQPTTTPAPEPEHQPPTQPTEPEDAAPDALNDTDDAPLLYTPEQAAQLLQVRPSWLRRRAAARAVPCRFLGKHLRFARQDIEDIATASLQQPGASRPR